MDDLATDFLVLGSGVAGLRAALALARSGRVLVVTKGQPTESNTGYAQGGIAVALAQEDSEQGHLEDTLAAGAGLVSRAAAEILVTEGPERVRELASWGARFDREEGRFHFTREAAHSRSRVLHALGDATGWEIVRTLLDKAHKAPEITVRSYACSTDLVVADGRVVGCRFLDRDGGEVQVLARATLVATGGLGRVFAETTNPPVATGDGVGMAIRAGAALLDMEFVQFHPTALAIAGAPRFLISEAVRGEGGRLVNGLGERFTDELLPRDQLARAVLREARAGHGGVFLDVRHLDPEHVRTRFPRIVATCLLHGIDLTQKPVPVTPAAHYMMGGIATDLDGRSSLEGLYAAGEAAGNGVHGANRLASNSLLEGLVFGARAASAMAEDPLPSPRCAAAAPSPVVRESIDVEDLRRRAWDALGLEREGESLKAFLRDLEPLRGGRGFTDRAGAEASNLVDVAWAMGRSALFREESRGAHFRLDFPTRDDAHFLGHTLLEDGTPTLSVIDRVLVAR